MIKKCPICNCTDITVDYPDNYMKVGCEYEGEVYCEKCGYIGTVIFYPVFKRNTFKLQK